MIRILIDEISSKHGRKAKHRKRIVAIEILNYVDAVDGSVGYSVWMFEEGKEIGRVLFQTDEYPVQDIVKLATMALAKLTEV